MNFTHYGFDVAMSEFNVGVVKAFKGIMSRLEEQIPDVDPFCSVILRWTTCLYQFPPCEGFKLTIPCTQSCELLITSYFGICLGDIISILDSNTDSILQNHFPTFGCRDYDDYYAGFKEQYFTNSMCFAPIPTHNGKFMCVCVIVCVCVWVGVCVFLHSI